MAKKFTYRGVVLFLILSQLLMSCEEIKERREKKKEKPVTPFLIDLKHYFSDAEKVLSFPCWFNDSLVKVNKIESITREIYSSSSEEDSLSRMLKMVKTYSFDENGELSNYQLDHFYEGMRVGGIECKVSPKDDFGLAKIKMKRTKSPSDNEILLQQEILSKEKYTDKYLVYENGDGNYRFFMLHEENWGALSIDSILNPQYDDIVTLGSPMRPSKKYQVENTVKEFNVVNWEYSKKFEHLKGVQYDKYPFHYKRSLVHDESGQCTGFIDSTFSDQRFLTRRVSSFKEQKGLPIKVIHENKSGKAKATYRQVENFRYSFYKD